MKGLGTWPKKEKEEMRWISFRVHSYVLCES